MQSTCTKRISYTIVGPERPQGGTNEFVPYHLGFMKEMLSLVNLAQIARLTISRPIRTALVLEVHAL